MTHVHRGIVGRRLSDILNNIVINEYESRWTGKSEKQRKCLSHCHIRLRSEWNTCTLHTEYYL